MRITAWIVVLGCGIAGCGGGSVTLPPKSMASTTPAATPTPIVKPTPAPNATPGLIYVGATASQIAVYSTAASGNVGPLLKFAGSTPVSASGDGIWAFNDGYAPLYPSGLPAAYATATRYAPDGTVRNAIRFAQRPISTGTTAATTDANANIYLANGLLERIPQSIEDPTCQYEGDGTVSEFAAGSTQASQAIRSIPVIETCSIFSLAFDRAGHLWVAGTSVLDQGVNGETEIPSISEYAVGPGSSGTPLRTLALNQGFVVDIALDSTDRVYAIYADQLVRYDANLQHPQVLLPAENGPDPVYGLQTADRIAIDAHDIVYVLTEASQAQPLAIREFAFPSTKPIRVITGANTALAGTGLALTR